MGRVRRWRKRSYRSVADFGSRNVECLEEPYLLRDREDHSVQSDWMGRDRRVRHLRRLGLSGSYEGFTPRPRTRINNSAMPELSRFFGIAGFESTHSTILHHIFIRFTGMAFEA